MVLPQPGDLIYIEKELPAVIVSDRDETGSNWGYKLCNIDSGQNALILESYVPSALSNRKVASRRDEMLTAEQEKMAKKLSPNKRPPYKDIPDGVLILVIAIGENIVEMVWNPDFCSIASI
tara:strand:+ start:1070 stop:1432 length:363 start_codon:yes stop_codon:yes gene_type:complete